MIDSIVILIVAIAPSITAIITSIIAIVKTIKNNKKLITDIKEEVEYKELKNKISTLIIENEELKTSLKELIKKIDKVR